MDNDLLLSAYNTIHNISLIIVGQPRFIGTKIWEENFVKVLKSTILEHSVYIDITCVLPEFDTWDKTFLQMDNTESGLHASKRIEKNYYLAHKFFYDVSDTGKKIGKIRIKKNKIENFIKTKLNFVNNIEFVYYDPYNFVKNLEIIHERQYGKKIYFNHGHWLNQHNCVQHAYYARQSFFDNLSEITPIIKVRYDYFFPNKTLWSTLGLLLNGSRFNNTNIIRDNNLEYLKKINNNPKVMLDCFNLDILFGNLCSCDYIHFFNKNGLILYAKQFIDWCFENVNERCCLLNTKVYTEKEKLKYKPEIILNKFFMDKCYHIKGSLLAEGNIYRYMTTEKDYYRQNWYDWSIEKIEELNKI